MRLLVEHRDAGLTYLSRAELLHALERVTRIRDVVRDQDPRVVEVDEVRSRRQDPRHLEPLVDARVVLDVHRVDVLDGERVPEAGAHEQAAAGDREDHVRVVAVVRDLVCEGPGRSPEVGPAHHLAVGGHA